MDRCAKALGYEVIEVNPSKLRSGTAIRRLFGEATQSHHVSSAEGNPKPGIAMQPKLFLVLPAESNPRVRSRAISNPKLRK